MARFKLTPVQLFRLNQAAEAICDVAIEINPKATKGDAYFAQIHLSSAARAIGEALAIANPPAAPPASSPEN